MAMSLPATPGRWKPAPSHAALTSLSNSDCSTCFALGLGLGWGWGLRWGWGHSWAHGWGWGEGPPDCGTELRAISARSTDERRHTCLATQYSSINGSLVWWNMRGSSVESDTLSPTVKNS